LGNIIITTIDNVYIAIRLSKIFLNNNLVNPANRKELIQNTLDDFSRNAIGFENNLVLDKPQPNTNDLQVLSSHDFTMIKSDYDIERKGFLRECRHINEYKQIIETIIVLMELELKNHKSYGCIKGKRDNEYKDFKGYWDNFIEIFPDRDGADLVAETLIHAYEFNPNGMTRVFDNTESYEDKQNRVSKNMGKSTAVEIQKLDVYKQYHKRLHDLINDKGL
jgi:hypothetical protein